MESDAREVLGLHTKAQKQGRIEDRASSDLERPSSRAYRPRHPSVQEEHFERASKLGAVTSSTSFSRRYHQRRHHQSALFRATKIVKRNIKPLLAQDWLN